MSFRGCDKNIASPIPRDLQRSCTTFPVELSLDRLGLTLHPRSRRPSRLVAFGASRDGIPAFPQTRSISRSREWLDGGVRARMIFNRPRKTTRSGSANSRSVLDMEKDSKPPFFSNAVVTGFLVFTWYATNIGVLLLNKYLLSNYGFKYPIFLTMCHMAACSICSYISVAWLKIIPLQLIQSRKQFFKIAALSALFCFSVVSGNISLRFLAVSFNQAIGATTPFFTAAFAYIMTFKRESWLTYASLIPVVLGVVIATWGEPSFHLFGFVICVAATAARALKSVVQGLLLQSDAEKLHSMNLLLYMAPIAVVLLLPATLFMEHGVNGETVWAITAEKAKGDAWIIPLLVINSATAYFVNLTNFLVTKHTSPLTLQVLGNAKGAVAVVVSILIFQNPVTVMGMVGYGITVAGVVAYGEAKKRS